MTQCTAKAKSTGERCTQPAMEGMNVCYWHGGMTPKGIASPHYKHGNRSKYMPERLAARYEEAIADPDLGSLKRNIALNEAIVREKLELLNVGGDSGEAWEIIAKALKDLSTHFNNEDYGKVLLTIEIMKEVVTEQQRYHMAIVEIQETLAEQRKDLKVKSDIEHKEMNAVSISNLMVFIGALISLINKVVPERDRRAEISEGIRKLISLDTRTDLPS